MVGKKYGLYPKASPYIIKKTPYGGHIMHYFRPALILAVALFATGCTRTSPSSESLPAEEHTQPEPTDQEQFTQLIDDIFLETVTESGLTLHTLISDPEAYGITDFPATLGDYSIEGIKNSYSEADELFAELKSIDRDALLSAQQLDYDILTAYLEAQQGGEDRSEERRVGKECM